MNAPTDRDDEFESAVRTRRRLVPRFDDTDDAEPSPELDRIVLARARDAMRPTVPTRPDMRERHYRGPRWAVPLALVATVLLSFTLVFQLDPARNDAVLAPREAAPVMANPEAAGELADVATDVAADGAADGAADDRAAAPPAIAAAASPQSAIAEVTAAPAPLAKSSPAAATPPSLPAAAAPSPAPSGPPSPPTPSPTSAPPVTGPLPSAAMSASEADLPMSAAQVSRAAGPQAGSRAGAPPPPVGSPTRDTSDPDAWLERIEGLRRNGAAEAARKELAAFVQRFPQHPLPAALEALRTDSAR